MKRAAAMLAALAWGAALGHGHPAAIADNMPDAWKYKLCGQMADVAMRAVHDRDKGLPMKQYPDDGGPGPRIANEIIRKVYQEPAIASPKRAETFGRAYCNEQLQER